MVLKKNSFAAFKANPPWASLPDSFWDFCLTYGRIRRYNAKQYLFFSGEEGNYVYFLLSGRIQILLTSEFNEKVFRVVKSPAFFPEALLDGKTYPYAVLALETSEALAIENKLLIRYLEEHPEFLWAFYRSISLDLRRAYRQIKNIALGDARQRIGAKLYALTHVHGKAKGDAVDIDIPLTATDLAAMCSLARESVSRILSELKEMEILEIEKKKITVRSVTGLRQWVNERKESQA